MNKTEPGRNDPMNPRFYHPSALYIEGSRSWGWLNSLLRGVQTPGCTSCVLLNLSVVILALIPAAAYLAQIQNRAHSAPSV